MKKVAKGNFGYTMSHRKIQWLKLMVYTLIALGVFLLGYLTTKTTKNLLKLHLTLQALPYLVLYISFLTNLRTCQKLKKWTQ